MNTTTRLTTADELPSMSHREKAGYSSCELIRGELKEMSPTGLTHGILCARLAALLLQCADENSLGVVCGAETGFLVEREPDTVLCVDVAFVSHERLKDVENLDKFVPFAPDLAVEVLSSGNTVNEIDEKIAFYFAAGARAVWIVNPKRRIVAVYSSPVELRILGEHDTLDGGGVLPGFTYELSKLFVAAGR